jgi:heptosyltransferase-2
VTPTAPVAALALRRVLIRLPNWLGDTVMALPTVRALRTAAPDAEMWCAGPWAETILAAEQGIAHRVATPGRLGARLVQARRWRAVRFDAAVVLPNSFETALAARLTGARLRVGRAGEGRGVLLTHALPAEPGTPHQIAEYLRLLRPLGIDPPEAPPTLPVSPADRAGARRLLAEVGVGPGEPAVGIQLGAAFGPSKLWPAARLAALARRLEARGARAVFLGSPDATGLLDEVRAAAAYPVRSLVGRDRPALLPALLAELDALVAPDSGPAHVAAAVGRPCVTLFGPTDPRLTAPAGPAQRCIWRPPPCAPCFLPRCPIDHRCLRAIEVDEVETAVAALLAR